MKSILLTFVMFFAFIFSANAWASSENETVYRFSNGWDYWYTTDYEEGRERTGYLYEEIAFRVFSEPPEDVRSFALFQCRFRNSFGHFISNYQDCEGHYLERLIGFAPEEQLGGMVPVLRCENMRVAGSVLTTIDEWDCRQRGFRVNGRLYGLVLR